MYERFADAKWVAWLTISGMLCLLALNLFWYTIILKKLAKELGLIKKKDRSVAKQD